MASFSLLTYWLFDPPPDLGKLATRPTLSQSNDAFELHKPLRSTDNETLKLGKVRSGG